MNLYIYTFLLSLLLSIAATAMTRAAAVRLGLVAYPRSDRWHSRPTALFGGVGIFVSLVLGYLLLVRSGAGGALALLLGATAMFALGAVDDRLRLKPHSKLLSQIIIAALFMRSGHRLYWLQSAALDQGLTLLWLVGITNALNLLDNIDGLAGGVALIGGLVLIYLCHQAGNPQVAALAAALVGACGGFLVFNFNPASIFMGDCGSLLLGFLLASMALLHAPPGGRRNLLAVLMGPVLLLLLPILDTTLVTVSRKLAGRPISTGGRDHTSHRLVALGLSERAATLTLWALAALAGGAAVLIHTVELFIGVALVALLLMALLFIAIFLGRVQVYGTGAYARLPRVNFLYKRRVFEVASDLTFIFFAYYVAFLLRFDGQLQEPFYSHFLQSLPVVMCVQLGTLMYCGLYRGVWRYTGMGDLLLQLRAVMTATGLSALMILLEFRFEGFSRAVLAMDGILLLLCIAGSRLSFRLMHAWVRRRRRREGRRVVIYGAGYHGELLLHELEQSGGVVPVGFLDDDPQKQGRVIHGLRVLGPTQDVKALLHDESVAEVLVAVRDLPEERLQLLREQCQQQGTALRRMRVVLE